MERDSLILTPSFWTHLLFIPLPYYIPLNIFYSLLYSSQRNFRSCFSPKCSPHPLFLSPNASPHFPYPRPFLLHPNRSVSPPLFACNSLTQSPLITFPFIYLSICATLRRRLITPPRSLSPLSYSFSLKFAFFLSRLTIAFPY